MRNEIWDAIVIIAITAMVNSKSDLHSGSFMMYMAITTAWYMIPPVPNAEKTIHRISLCLVMTKHGQIS